MGSFVILLLLLEFFLDRLPPEKSAKQAIRQRYFDRNACLCSYLAPYNEPLAYMAYSGETDKAK